MLSSREQEIDEYISKAKEQSYKQVLDLGQKGVSALMQTAIKVRPFIFGKRITKTTHSLFNLRFLNSH